MTKTFISRWTTHLCGLRDRYGTETDSATNRFLIVVPPQRARYVALPRDRILSSACAALVMTMRRPHWRPVHRLAPDFSEINHLILLLYVSLLQDKLQRTCPLYVRNAGLFCRPAFRTQLPGRLQECHCFAARRILRRDLHR